MKALCGDLGQRISELQHDVGTAFTHLQSALRSIEGLRGIYAEIIAAQEEEPQQPVPEEFTSANPTPMRPPVPKEEYAKPDLPNPEA